MTHSRDDGKVWWWVCEGESPLLLIGSWDPGEGSPVQGRCSVGAVFSLDAGVAATTTDGKQGACAARIASSDHTLSELPLFFRLCAAA